MLLPIPSPVLKIVYGFILVFGKPTPPSKFYHDLSLSSLVFFQWVKIMVIIAVSVVLTSAAKPGSLSMNINSPLKGLKCT